ncbi:MAG: hypothetical protein JRH11_04090 [Deltaproteobacteria bacterium]|nr:hypothetical protein [Deltaproteobacteria bacterium]
MRPLAPLTSFLFVGLFALGTLAACSDSHGRQTDADVAHADAGADADAPDATPGDAAVDGAMPACPRDPAAAEGTACPVEGQSCGECSPDPCTFCNVLVCVGGTWSNLEAHPAPCHECGDAGRCTSVDQYCEHMLSDTEDPDTYQCLPLPDACLGDLTCGCLESSLMSGSCTGEGTTGLTVQVGGA